MVGQVVGWLDMTLTALAIKNAKPGMHADGGGLYLHVAYLLARGGACNKGHRVLKRHL